MIGEFFGFALCWLAILILCGATMGVFGVVAYIMFTIGYVLMVIFNN